MYDLLYSIIGHEWVSSYATGDQTYLYVGCILLICIFTFYFLDLILGFIFKIINRSR